MFNNNFSLRFIPAFPGSVAALTNISAMMAGCIALQSFPAFPSSIAGVTNMANFLSGCSALQFVAGFSMAGIGSAGNASSFVANCNSLPRIPVTGMRFSFSVANGKLSAAALNEVFTGLPTVTGQTITVTGNFGINQGGYNAAIATAKGWTVTA
jgi:hypothetical protein